MVWGDVRTLAAEQLDAFAAVVRAARGALDPPLRGLAADVVGSTLGLAGGPFELERGLAESAFGTVRAFAEQFVVDVGAMSEIQRGELFAALGDRAVTFAQVLWVADMGGRLGVVSERLFGSPFRWPDPTSEGSALWAAVEPFMTSVARRNALDPLMTELVRLRGARIHKCRICQSRRSVSAINQGADESTFDDIDRYETAAFSDRQKAALRLCDATVFEPGRISDDLVQHVQQHLSPDEAVEILLDVVRNALNKIAVAFGGDAAEISDGTQRFDIDPAGEVVVVA